MVVAIVGCCRHRTTAMMGFASRTATASTVTLSEPIIFLQGLKGRRKPAEDVVPAACVLHHRDRFEG